MALAFSVGVFALLNLLAAMSPGPDFLVVSKNSISHTRAVGVATALGVGVGIFVHVSYSIIGIGLIISKSLLLFSIIKLLGALYLAYLGVRLLASTAVVRQNQVEVESAKSFTSAFKEGFVVNALNPKASIFFVSLFSQFFSQGTPPAVEALYGIEAALVVCAWFVCLAYMLTHSHVKTRIERVQHPITKIMGAALIALGIKVAFSHR